MIINETIPIPRHRFTTSLPVDNKIWRKKTHEKYIQGGCSETTKCSDDDKKVINMKRDLRHSSIPTSLMIQLPIYTPPPTEESFKNQGRSSVRHIRTSGGIRRNISRPSKHREEEMKTGRKNRVNGALMSILGNEQSNGWWDISSKSDDTIHHTSRTKVRDTALATTTDNNKAFPGSRRRRLTRLRPGAYQKSENTEKRDRKQSVIGSLASILGPEMNSPSPAESDDRTNLAPKINPNPNTPIGNESCSLINLKKYPRLRIAKCLKRKEKNRRNQRKSVSESLMSILGPQSPAAVRKTINYEHSLHSRQSRRSKQISAKKTEQQIICSQPKNIRNIKKIHFEGIKVREHIQTKLNMMSPRSVRAKIANIHVNAIQAMSTKTTSKQPRFKSRAKRNGRLYSVCKRIPASIPEHGILEMNKSSVPKITVLKAKSSFSLRSPRSSKQRSFRVFTPHPTECGVPGQGDLGDLCMTFPIRDSEGGKVDSILSESLENQNDAETPKNSGYGGKMGLNDMIREAAKERRERIAETKRDANTILAEIQRGQIYVATPMLLEAPQDLAKITRTR